MEDLCDIQRVQACKKYKIAGRFPPGPCRKTMPKGAQPSDAPDAAPEPKKAAPAKVAKKTAVASPADTKPAKKAAAPKKAAGTSRAFERVSREQAAELQKQMLAGNPWTASQRAALAEYSAFFYKEMNGQLRGLDVADDVYPEEDINRAIRNAVAGLRPLPRPVKVFRNVDSRAVLGRQVTDAAEREAGLKKLDGKTRQERGFSSTSIRDDLKDFGDEIQLEIDVPAGIPAAFIRSISDEPDEDELVLSPGVHYTFEGPPRRAEDGRLIMKARVSMPTARGPK